MQKSESLQYSNKAKSQPAKNTESETKIKQTRKQVVEYMKTNPIAYKLFKYRKVLIEV